MKCIISVLFLLLFYSESLSAFTEYEDEQLNSLFKRWTNVQKVSDHAFVVTFLSPQLVERWHEKETDKDAKSRIGTLLNSIKNEGYVVYLMRIIVGGYSHSIKVDSIPESFVLSIAEPNATQRRPDAFSPNLQAELRGHWDKPHGRTYYGVLAYKIGHDKFSFQTLSFSATEAKYECCGYMRKWKKVEHYYPLDVQFSFLPNGVPSEARISDREKLKTSDVINFLSLAVDLVSLLSPVKVLR